MLLNFLSIGSDGAYYFPLQVLHKLFFMMYRELEDLRRWPRGICFYVDKSCVMEARVSGGQNAPALAVIE